MGLFLIFLYILCAILYGISAYASYIAGATGNSLLICFVASVV